MKYVRVFLYQFSPPLSYAADIDLVKTKLPTFTPNA